MSTVIGDKSQFGIEVMIEPELIPPSHVWGRMCIWVSNFRIGDFEEEHCGLAQCVHHLAQVASDLPSLNPEIFDGKTDQHIASYLYQAWFDSGYDDDGIKIGNAAEMHKYRFDYGFAEMFDREHMSFIFDVGCGNLKLLYLESPNHEVKGFSFKRQLFLQVVERFQHWFLGQSERLESANA